MNQSEAYIKKPMQLGLYTLGDMLPNKQTGALGSYQKRMEEMIQAAKLADDAGLDIFGVGEHHRLDYAVSATAVVLAAIARETKNIILTSATTVLSTTDPVRLYEEYASLDLLSNGRAEIIAGRGAFIESFPLFGFDLDEYDELFSEHLQLFLELNKQAIVSWNGHYRADLHEAEISPRPIQKQIPIWIGVGGTEESARKAATYGSGMMLAMLNGTKAKFKPLVDIYRKTINENGRNEVDYPVGVTGHAFIGETSQKARDTFYPYYADYKKYVSAQLGKTIHLTRNEFEEMTAPNQVVFVGSSQEIIEKILAQYEMFGHSRFLAQMDIGGLPYREVEKSIERFAVEVAPVIRRETSK